MYVMRDSHTGALPMLTRRNAMKGKSFVASDVSVNFCNTSRERGPATVRPTIESESVSKRIELFSGRCARNQRGWCTSAACEPQRKNSSSPIRETENSPTIFPSGLSIAVSDVLPIFGNALVKRCCNHAAEPSPLTLYLAKFEASEKPTRSRTARDSSPTFLNALER